MSIANELKIMVVLKETAGNHKNVGANKQSRKTPQTGVSPQGEAQKTSKCITPTNHYWGLETIVN
jgi:hypothetical protein